MRIATVNVNGIRAAARKGMGKWLASSAPDILLLQEVRADEQIAVDLLPGYEAAIWPCRIKGRAGVGVAVRDGGPATLGELRYGVAAPGTEEPDVDSGRWLEADLSLTGFDGIERLTVISAYLHSGQLGTEKMDQKYAHLELVDTRMAELLAAARDGGPQVVMAGDLNVVRSERDIKNWKPNTTRSPASWTRRSPTWRAGSPPAGWTPRATSWGTRSRGPTRGGPSAARPSTTTPAGGSTTRSSPPPWPSGPTA